MGYQKLFSLFDGLNYSDVFVNSMIADQEPKKLNYGQFNDFKEICYNFSHKTRSIRNYPSK